jgi:hypothetical protein
MRTHTCEWSGYRREGFEHYIQELDCDTCGRQFVGHGWNLESAMNNANRRHEVHISDLSVSPS